MENNIDNNLENMCRDKEAELIHRYFPSHDATESRQVSSETIGSYTQDLPLKIEAEYREFLEEIWKGYSNQPLVLEEQKLRSLMTDDDCEAIETAHRDASRITLWERITRTNHEDVDRYIGLLRDYTRELLTVMRLDFLEEITGRHITGKTFEP